MFHTNKYLWKWKKVCGDEFFLYISQMKKIILDDGNKTHGYYCDELGNFYSSRQGVLKKMKHSISHSGYPVIGFLIEGRKKQKTYRAHRIIATTFLPNPNNLPVVDHIDGNLNNFSLSNLRWSSYSDNSKNINNKHPQIKINFSEKELSEQIWKPLTFFEGCRITNVEISNLGILKYKDSRKISKIKHPSGKQGSYPLYKFRKIKKGSKVCVVHKLVWLSFNGNYDQSLVINHKDGNKENCRLENLEIVTQSENLKHAFQSGLMNPNRVFLNQSMVNEIFEDFYKNHMSSVDIRKKYRKGSKEIQDLLSGKNEYVKYSTKQKELIESYKENIKVIMSKKSKKSSHYKIRNLETFKKIIELHNLGFSTRKIESFVSGIKKSAIARYVQNNFEILREEQPELFG
jgi:hypothetical protein